jgi:hypothetical protein
MNKTFTFEGNEFTYDPNTDYFTLMYGDKEHRMKSEGHVVHEFECFRHNGWATTVTLVQGETRTTVATLAGRGAA